MALCLVTYAVMIPLVKLLKQYFMQTLTGVALYFDPMLARWEHVGATCYVSNHDLATRIFEHSSIALLASEQLTAIYWNKLLIYVDYYIHY